MAIGVTYAAAFPNAGGDTAVDSVTIPANSNSTLVVFVAFLGSSGRDVLAIELDGVALTRRGIVRNSDLTNLAVYTLENPRAAGTVDLVTYLNESTVNYSRFVVLVDAGGGYAALATDTDDSVDIASAIGGLVVGFVASRNTTSYTPGAGQTSVVSDVSTGYVIRGIASSEAGASTVTTSFTIADGDFPVIAAVAIAAASGATVAKSVPWFFLNR